MNKKMIVISLDAVGNADFDKLIKLPNFARIFERAAYCDNVHSIYPSLTYPAHTSIVTGRYPAQHGIVNNTLLQPGWQSPDWYWQRKYVKGTTVYDEAIKKGMTVCSLLWPVTARSKIQYNVPEIFCNRPWGNQILTSLLNGTPVFQYVLNSKFGHLRNGKKNPELDNFTHESLKYTLKEVCPDLTLVHFTDVDSQRHEYGYDSAEAHEALLRHDARIGELLDLMPTIGLDLSENTTLILLGDHSQMDVGQVILLNRIFLEKGYLEAENGRITDYRAICKNCDGSAYIYINPKKGTKEERNALRREIASLLVELRADAKSGIRKIYTRKSAAKMGADPGCDFMLEATYGYYFQDELDEADLHEVQKATHGYHPRADRKYQTFFMIAGPDIEPGVSVDKMCLVDEGPVIARILGVDLPGAVGRAPEHIFRKK